MLHRIPALDGVRGFAVLWVMIYHFTYQVRTDTVAVDLVYRMFRYGDRAVDLFFVLSGFLITGILLQAKEKAPALAPYLKNFYWRRTLRIFPLYYLALAIILIGSLLFVAPTPAVERLRENQWMLWGYVSNMGLAFVDHRLFDAGGIRLLHFWSLAIEEQFYILWPLVVWVLPRRALIGVCLLSGVVSAGSWYLLSSQGWSSAPWYFTLCRTDGLCAGAAMAALLPTVARLAWLRRLVAAVATIGISLLLLAILLEWDKALAGAHIGRFILRHAINFAGELGMAAGIGLVAMGHLPWADRLLSLKPLTFLGKYSYGLYVWHYAVVMHVSFAFLTPGKLAPMLTMPGALVASSVIGIALSIGLALLSYHLFEERFLLLKDRKRPAQSTDEVVPPVVAPQAAVPQGS